MSSEANETIIYNTFSNKIASITLNRPEKLNAFRIDEFNTLLRALTLAENDPEVSVIKIDSKGDRAFSSGLDLGMIQELTMDQSKITELLETGEKVVKTFAKLTKPIVLQIQGPAVGWGAILALIADFVIAGDNPKTFFSLNEIDVGIFPGTGALTSALLAVGLKEAKRLLMIPEKIFLDRAIEINLVTKRVELENLEAETNQFCQNLAEKSPIILRSIKGTLNYMHLSMLEKLFSQEREGFKLFMKDDPSLITGFFEQKWSEK